MHRCRCEDANRWINVARVTNLAEAGFLVDELAGEGIDARIYQSEDFSALTDRWMVSYLIQVAAARGPGGRGANSPPSGRDGIVSRARWRAAVAGRAAGDRPALWRPVALVILAGMASFVARPAICRRPRSPHGRRAIRSPAPSAAIGRPLVTEPAPACRVIDSIYHWREQAWYLDTDADGDGRYESPAAVSRDGVRGGRMNGCQLRCSRSWNSLRVAVNDD